MSAVRNPDLNPNALAPLRGFNPTNAQEEFLAGYLERVRVPFARLNDRALKEFFEKRGLEWPEKYPTEL